MQKLLSICIPTFNRSSYLNTCLTSIVQQLDQNSWDQIEFIVIDNDSPDDTKKVVEKFLNEGYPIQYCKNNTNIGLDGNLTKAFAIATGKYVQVLGDDDLWIKGKIADLLNLLKNVDYGVVYIRPLSFTTPDLPETFLGSNKYYLYHDNNEFIYSVNIMITFTSSNIVNKALVVQNADFKIDRFLGTEVNLLNWIFTAALAANANVITKDYFIASKADNNSGYKFFKVFGINFNLVLDYFLKNGLKTYVSKRINYMLTVYFFPKYLQKINNANWTYDDNIEEIKSFIKGYRGGDRLNKIFLKSNIDDNNSLLSIRLPKFIIEGYNRVRTKYKQLSGILTGQIEIREITNR